MNIEFNNDLATITSGDSSVTMPISDLPEPIRLMMQDGDSRAELAGSVAE